MCDNDKLEVGMILPFVDNAANELAWLAWILRHDRLDKASC